jgi:hypothetical protein
MSNGKKRNSVELREWLTHGFSLAEDSIYIGFQNADAFDIIHFHNDYLHYSFSERIDTPPS